MRKSRNQLLLGLCLLVAGVILVISHHRPIDTPEYDLHAQPHPVVLSGYSADAMEPFITRDGRYLLFNNLNEPSVNTDIHYAERQDDFTWQYRGLVQGINTTNLEGCPTLDRSGRMFFVSPRNYAQTLCTIYTGQFQTGAVTQLQPVESISLKQPGQVNFDVDVSPDGTTLIFVDSRFKPGSGPQYSHLVIAQWNGSQFVRSPDSARMLAPVNAAGLNYAPTISSNQLTLFFTRFDRHSRYPGPQIYRTTRPTTNDPFAPPAHVEGLGDYVEGSAFSPDEHLLYFHRKDGPRFSLYTVPIR